MRYRILIFIIVLSCGLYPLGSEANSNHLKIGPVLNAGQAKAIFEKIDSSLEFTESSNEYFGVTDQIFYASLLTDTSQTTVNIGKRSDENKPFTNIYVSVSADKPLNEKTKQELNGLIDKYIFCFLTNAFDDGHLLIKRDSFYIGTDFSNQNIEIESENYNISFKIKSENGNPHYITCLLRVTENNFQKELNQRIIKKIKP